jgi:hypothetical protein
VDWGHLGTIEMDGQQRTLNGFTFALGYRRAMMAEAALDQKLGTLLKRGSETEGKPVRSHRQQRSETLAGAHLRGKGSLRIPRL